MAPNITRQVAILEMVSVFVDQQEDFDQCSVYDMQDALNEQGEGFRVSSVECAAAVLLLRTSGEHPKAYRITELEMVLEAY